MNILLKETENILLNVDLSTMPQKNSVSTMRIPTISKTERYIDKIYDKTVKSKLKKEILLELQHRFPTKKSIFYERN